MSGILESEQGSESCQRRLLGEVHSHKILQCRRDDIPAVHAFSCRVFDTQVTPSNHPSVDEWYTRYDERKGMIMVVVNDAIGEVAGDESDESIRERICSYLFAYESESVQLSGKSCMHIWLCATESQHRGKGLTRELFALVSREAIFNRTHIKILAINTFPAYFPNMYRLLSRSDSGFECVVVKRGR